MHIGRLIARLNPSTVRFDVGVGGIPELTAQDVAAALGMVRHDLGARLLQVAYGDAHGAELQRTRDLLCDAQRDEWLRREHRVSTAAAALGGAGRPAGYRERREFDDARADRWPRWITDVSAGETNPLYATVRAGVLTEVRQPMRCHACAGRGEVLVDGLVSVCSICRGTGYSAASSRGRARLLGIAEGPYRRNWQSVYEWTLEACGQAMDSAARDIVRALAA